MAAWDTKIVTEITAIQKNAILARFLSNIFKTVVWGDEPCRWNRLPCALANLSTHLDIFRTGSDLAGSDRFTKSGWLSHDTVACRLISARPEGATISIALRAPHVERRYG